MKTFQEFVSAIEENTDNNMHTENMMLIVEFYGDDNDLNIANEVARFHLDNGSMNLSMINIRTSIIQSVISRLPKAKYEAIYNAL